MISEEAVTGQRAVGRQFSILEAVEEKLTLWMGGNSKNPLEGCSYDSRKPVRHLYSLT